MSSAILVIGSCNTDMVIKTAAFPRPGETLLGGSFFMFPGGKGANQAVAAARLGGKVTLIAKIGNDIFGAQALEQFRNEGIHAEHVITDMQHPSGVALITVDSKGENTIVVAQGANGMLTPLDLQQRNGELINHAIVLMQLETPIDTILYAARTASSHHTKVILNPAPATSLPDELFPDLYLLTPNRTEAEVLTGIDTSKPGGVKQAAYALMKKSVLNVIITMGSEGSYVFTGTEEKHIRAVPVKAVDTTAAGDVFNGALAVALAEGASLIAAAGFANQAAALSVTKMGAQSSAPYRKEITTTLT